MLASHATTATTRQPASLGVVHAIRSGFPKRHPTVLQVSLVQACAGPLGLGLRETLFLPEPNLIEVRFPDDVLKRPEAEKRRLLFRGDQPISVLGRRVTISR